MKGIIISKEGHSVKDDSEFQYVDTETPLFKLFNADKGLLSLNSEPGPYTFEIPHNLGYYPMYFLFGDFDSDRLRRFVGSQANVVSGDETVLWTTLGGDKNNIIVQLTSVSGTSSPITGEFGYNFLIFYDKVES